MQVCLHIVTNLGKAYNLNTAKLKLNNLSLKTLASFSKITVCCDFNQSSN